MTQTLRVLVADDEQLARDGVGVGVTFLRVDDEVRHPRIHFLADEADLREVLLLDHRLDALDGAELGGEGGVLGNACEFKNCLLMDGVQVPHFNYVGDSILGNGAHLGAGAICSNLRLDRQPVVVRGPAGNLPTGLVKLGAILGDRAEVGCNAVLNPGSVLGRRALVMPTVPFSGYLPDATIAHVARTVRLLPRRD